MQEGFPPVVDERSRVVLLGTMPGERSLQKREYYGHPRNHFWPLLYRLFDRERVDEAYEERLAFALAHRVALWDVLRGCEREGSLDAAIREPEANEFAAFFAQHPGVRAVAFNGAAAEKLFRTHVPASVVPEGLRFVRLPSSSPAHAVPFERKLAAWRVMAELADLWGEGELR